MGETSIEWLLFAWKLDQGWRSCKQRRERGVPCVVLVNAFAAGVTRGCRYPRVSLTMTEAPPASWSEVPEKVTVALPRTRTSGRTPPLSTCPLPPIKSKTPPPLTFVAGSSASPPPLENAQRRFRTVFHASCSGLNRTYFWRRVSWPGGAVQGDGYSRASHRAQHTCRG